MHTTELVTHLRGLRANNEKSWFEAHRKEYEGLRQQFVELVTSVIKQASTFEPGLAALDPKKCLFRINRDIRFSANKSPYKTHFSAMLPLGPINELHTGYYFHIDADGDLIVGSGLHGLQPADLEKVRRFLSNRHAELTAILEEAKTKGFGELQGEQLKTAPRGYSADHPAIEYLKYKEFRLTHSEQVSGIKDDLAQHIVAIIKDTQPLVEYLQQAIG